MKMVIGIGMIGVESAGLPIGGEINIEGEVCTHNSPCCSKCEKVPLCILTTRLCKERVHEAPCGRIMGYLDGDETMMVDGGYWVAERDSYRKSQKQSKDRKTVCPEGFGIVVYRNTAEHRFIKKDNEKGASD